MVFPDWLLAPLITGSAAAGALAINRLISRVKLKRTLPRLAKLYRLLDPLLAEVLGRWSGSKVQQATEILVVLLADGELSAEEIRWAAQQVMRRYSPAAGAEGAKAYLANGSAAKEAVGSLVQLIDQGHFRGAGPQAAARALKTTIAGVL